MNQWFKPVGWAIVLWMTAGLATAQQTDATAPKATAQSEAGEPRATLSPAAPAPAAAGPGTAVPASTAPAAQTGKAAPRAATASSTATPGAATPTPKSGKADRLDLGTATVTGDREQPKVMYIVPWKRSDIGDLSGKPMNSLLDEALAPVDRAEFKREVAYYDAVHADAPRQGADKSAGQQGEK